MIVSLALSIPAEVYVVAWTVLLFAAFAWGVRGLNRLADRWDRRAGR